MPVDLTTKIETAATRPASATSDGQSASSHSLPDLIEADKYLTQKNAVQSGKVGWGACRAAQAVPPSALGQ